MGRRKHRSRGRKWSSSQSSPRRQVWYTPTLAVTPEAIHTLADQHFGGRYYQVGHDHD